MSSAVCQFVARRLLYVSTTRTCVAGNYDIVDKEGIKQQQGEGKELQIITSSLRLDAVAARGLDLSRRKIWHQALFGNILVNGKVTYRKSKEIKEGDVIEVSYETAKDIKRTGKVIVQEIGPRTAKNKYSLDIVRYKNNL